MGCRSGKLEELYEYYTSCSGVYHAGRTTFYKVFKSHWSKALKFRHLGQHARCSTCAKLGEMRLLANTREAKEHVQTMYDEHVTSVFKDRATMANLERLSAERAHGPALEPQKSKPIKTAFCICVLREWTKRSLDSLATSSSQGRARKIGGRKSIVLVSWPPVLVSTIFTCRQTPPRIEKPKS